LSGGFVARAELLEALVAVEGMLLALELFLIGKLLAGGEHAVLRFEGRGIWSGWLRRRNRAARCRNAGYALRRLRDLHASDKALQIAFLLGAEIAGLICGRGFEIDLAHSAGTRVAAASDAGAAARGLCVR
jgi:hypothetical protein